MLLTPIMEASEKLLFCFFVYGDDLSLFKLNTFSLNTENKDKQKKSREHTSTKKKRRGFFCLFEHRKCSFFVPFFKSKSFLFLVDCVVVNVCKTSTSKNLTLVFCFMSHSNFFLFLEQQQKQSWKREMFFQEATLCLSVSFKLCLQNFFFVSHKKVKLLYKQKDALTLKTRENVFLKLGAKTVLNINIFNHFMLGPEHFPRRNQHVTN